MSAPTFITAVTGSTRCGTTVLMRMLHVGGVSAYADNLISFESRRVLGLPRDAAWLAECPGRAVKLLEPLYLLPLPRVPWRFILMRRDPVEQARSQIKFMRLIGGEPIRDAVLPSLAASLRADLPRMRNVLAARGPVLEVAFEDVLAAPLGTARLVEAFLGVPLDTERMAAEVLPRSAACYPGMLESTFVEPEPAEART